MAEVSSTLPSTSQAARPVAIPQPRTVIIPSASDRSQYLGLDALSPVNQNGSFEFDRVLKSGDVNKRSRKTRSWKRFHLVLRPNCLSVYKSRNEEKLLKQLRLSDITAVAILKDPKGRRSHMFGVFSPSRNFHFQAQDDAEARAWVDTIKREARVDEEDSVTFGSPPASGMRDQSIDQYVLSGDEGAGDVHLDRGISSSPEPMEIPGSYTTTRDGIRVPALRKTSANHQELDYSGAEQGSFSDFSDGGQIRVKKSVKVGSVDSEAAQHNRLAVGANSSQEAQPRPSMGRNFSGNSTVVVDEERVVYHGYLLILKSKGGVRQWKRLWTVLRPKNVSFYKNEDEYAAQLILPLSSILSAVEIDPISKTKDHCMQIIAEEKSFRFCAPSEEALARWLGAIKSQLAKRKEKVASTADV